MINHLSRLALCQQSKQSYPSPVCYILFLGTRVSHPGTNFQDIELPEIIFFEGGRGRRGRGLNFIQQIPQTP